MFYFNIFIFILFCFVLFVFICTELLAGVSSNSSFSVLEVVIELTEEGLKKRWEVINIVFNYIQMLKEEGAKEWIYNENKSVDEIQFRFKDKESPDSFVSSLSQRMQKYDYSHLLNGPYYYQSFNAELTNKIINEYLTPQNLRIYLVSKGKFYVFILIFYFSILNFFSYFVFNFSFIYFLLFFCFNYAFFLKK